MLRRTLIVTSLLALGLSASAGATDLLEIYERARLNDPQLRVAEAQRLSVGEGVAQARSALLPRITGSAGFSRSGNEGIQANDVEFDSSSNNRRLNLELSQSIYDHRNYTRLNASRADAGRGEANYQAALNNLFLRVAEAYFNVLTAQDGVGFAQAEERAIGRQLEQAEQRFEVGLSAITDVLEARARFDGARARVISAQNNMDDAFEALTELTGDSFADLRRLQEELPLEAPTPNDPEAWVQRALADNPTLLAREMQLRAAGFNIETQWAGHYPTVGGSVSLTDSKLLSGDIGPFATRQSEQTVAGIQVTIPFFEGLGTQSRYRQAVHDRDAVEEQLEQDRRAIVRQTRGDFRAVIAGISEVEARRQALVSAQSAVEATQAGFEVGTRTIVDVLLSQQQLFQAERDYSVARHSFIVNRLRLKRSAGVIDLADLREVNALLVR